MKQDHSPTEPQNIRKRDGQVVAFDRSKVTEAIRKCLVSVHQPLPWPIGDIAGRAIRAVFGRDGEQTTVERMQDAVENALMGAGMFDAARHYITYREERARARREREELIPDDVRSAFDLAKSYFPTPLQEFQYFDKYSRFDWGLMRRETWVETIRGRAVPYLQELTGQPDRPILLSDGTEIGEMILTQQAMPSMRLLAMAGAPARRSNISIYNCSAVGVSCLEAFKEALVISMEGCGLGFSVEMEYVSKLPFIKLQTGRKAPTFVVEDDSMSWADAVLAGLQVWFDGGDIDFDTSAVRPAGSILKTKGGRASGPEPLKKLLSFLRQTVLSRQGAMLRPIDAHDMMCVIADAAIMGGVRRMAMLSLYDQGDESLRHAKTGSYPNFRWNANNSEAWRRLPTELDLLSQMTAMFRGNTGEPGIFNPHAMFAPRRKPGRFLVNPCGEIYLLDMEFCNLTQAVCRPGDTGADLRRKVEAAAILGTIQARATHFPGLRPEWRENCERERLLGVDLNGQQDCVLARSHEMLRQLRDHAINVNRIWSERLGQNQSAAITCQKPNGNSSTLLHCGPGGHGWIIRQGIRNVRVSAHSPIYRVLRDAGVPMDPENGQTAENANTWVAHFPYKAPPGAVLQRDLPAIEQLERWKGTKLHWTEHNPSVSIGYRAGEEIAIIGWLRDNLECIGGLTFFPIDDAEYDQPAYVETTPEEYERLAAAFPKIDFSLIWRYEREDYTTAAQELACAAGSCLIG